MARRRSRQSRPHGSAENKKEQRAQSAVEYLLTYGWAILIVIIIVALLLYFVLAPSFIAPSTCTFVSGAYCKGMIFASNTLGTKVGMFLTNLQSYPVLNPSVSLNLSGVAYTGNCLPSFVLPGGAIICNVTLPQKALALGALESGKLYLSAIPCPSGNATVCKTSTPQTFLGGFNAHVSPLFSSTTATVVLNATNLTQAANGGKDTLIATVKMLGYPLEGATVNFTENVTFATITPTITTTGSNGKAYSEISSLQQGKVLVTAAFASYSNSIIINFTPPVYVSFEILSCRFSVQ